MFRLKLALLLLTVAMNSLAAQSIDDLLPAGMKLDDQGKLQWSEWEAAPCGTCEGKKRIDCAACKSSPEGCARCEKGEISCPPCRGDGKTPDPYLSTDCRLCFGQGFNPCKTCGGSQKVVKKDGSRIECTQCKGTGGRPCALCAPHGRLAIRGLQAGDPRRTARKKLCERRKKLAALIRELDGPKSHRADGLQNYERHLELAAEFLVLATDPVEKLKEFVGRAALEEGSRSQDSFPKILHHSALTHGLRFQIEVIDLCLWRLRKNAGESKNIVLPSPSRVSWDLWFASSQADPRTSYTLLGSNYFRAERSKDFDQLLAAWLRSRPKATMQLVAVLYEDGGLSGAENLYHVRVQNGEEDLTHHLIGLGAVSAGATLPATPRIELPHSLLLNDIKRALKAEEAARAKKIRIWKASELSSEAHLSRAKSLKEEGELADAIAAFHDALEAGAHAAYAWLDIGACFEGLGQIDKALEAYDHAIGDGGWWDPYSRRADCLARHRGVKAAVEWLGLLEKAAPKDFKFAYLQGLFFMRRRDAASALPNYLRAIDILLERNQVKFDDEGWLKPLPKKPGKNKDPLNGFWPVLQYTAETYYELGKMDETMRYATMGVAVGQRSNSSAKFAGPAAVEAGNATCRLLRARVFLSRNEWKEAWREINFARVLSDGTNYQGWAKEIADLETWMKKNRPVAPSEEKKEDQGQR